MEIKSGYVKLKCPQCGATLLQAKTADIQIKCYRCKTVINFEISGKSVKHTVENRE